MKARSASPTSVADVVGDDIALSLAAADVRTLGRLVDMRNIWSEKGMRDFLIRKAKLTVFNAVHTIQMTVRFDFFFHICPR